MPRRSGVCLEEGGLRVHLTMVTALRPAHSSTQTGELQSPLVVDVEEDIWFP